MKNVNVQREVVTGVLYNCSGLLNKVGIKLDDGRVLDGRMPAAVKALYVRDGKRITMSCELPFQLPGFAGQDDSTRIWRFENARGVKIG